MTGGPARREVVTGGRGEPSYGLPGAAGRTDAGPSAPDDARLRALVRAQLRTALTAAAALAVPLGTLPLLLDRVPAVSRARIGGVALTWPLLGVVGYPLMYLIGRWYVARAEANEARHQADRCPPGRLTPRLDGDGGPR
ncbi:hypothetical protein [Streptomyces sp. ICBB 8177]|uniref:hypothetical protein n=1 Tax=Streptomyces sp. ICBB 8177 TaxID=563922 RepID=UPI000D67C733|nr:hypothetical protein [Streptomyces sp. ICBB 8177]PWI40996.1 hypothetical protein CK485_26790 [Streptomyces sp. ICBB 8177]